MVTITDICNQSLGAIGARSTITNINENSNEAKKCRLYFDNTRDALLRAAQWNFSRKSAYLSLLKAAPGTPENPSSATNAGPWNPLTMPALPWLYSYAYPDDAVRVWMIQPYQQTNVTSGVPIFTTSNEVPAYLPGRRGARFIEGIDSAGPNNLQRVLLTNQEQAIAVYGMRVENPALWDSQFQTAMIGSLAWRLAIPLSGDKTMAKMAHDSAVEAVSLARVSDGNEGSTNVNKVPDWIAIRGYEGDWISTTAEAYCAGWENPNFLGL